MKTLLLSIFAIILLASCGSDPVQPETDFTEKFMKDSTLTYIQSLTTRQVKFIEDNQLSQKMGEMYKTKVVFPEYNDYEYCFYNATFTRYTDHVSLTLMSISPTNLLYPFTQILDDIQFHEPTFIYYGSPYKNSIVFFAFRRKIT